MGPSSEKTLREWFKPRHISRHQAQKVGSGSVWIRFKFFRGGKKMLNTEYLKYSETRHTAFFQCSFCGVLLPALVELGKDSSIVLKNLKWGTSPDGFLCPRCQEDFTRIRDDMHQTESPALQLPAPRKRREERERNIIDAVSSHPEGLTLSRIALVTGYSRTTVAQRLSTLLKAGRLRRRDGLYVT